MDNIRILENAGKLGKWCPQLQVELSYWSQEASKMPAHLQEEFAEKIVAFIHSINWSAEERAELEAFTGLTIPESSEAVADSSQLATLPKHFIMDRVIRMNTRKTLPPEVSHNVKVTAVKQAVSKETTKDSSASEVLEGTQKVKKPCCGHGKTHTAAVAREAKLIAKKPLPELDPASLSLSPDGEVPRRILGHECMKCTIKHLVTVQALLQRDEDPIMVIGNLACAFNHSGIKAIDDLLNNYKTITDEDVAAVIKDIELEQPFNLTDRTVKNPKDLCVEYLAISVVIAMEIVTGYNTEEYHTALMGNLAIAQDWATLRNIDIANRIRDFRLFLYPDGPRIVNLTPLNISVLKALANVNFDVNAHRGLKKKGRSKIFNRSTYALAKAKETSKAVSVPVIPPQ